MIRDFVPKSKQRGGGWLQPQLLEGCGCKLERGLGGVQGHVGGVRRGVEEGWGMGIIESSGGEGFRGDVEGGFRVDVGGEG